MIQPLSAAALAPQDAVAPAAAAAGPAPVFPSSA